MGLTKKQIKKRRKELWVVLRRALYDGDIVTFERDTGTSCLIAEIGSNSDNTTYTILNADYVAPWDTTDADISDTQKEHIKNTLQSVKEYPSPIWELLQK